MLEIKQILEEHAVIAKIENEEGIQNAKAIAEVSDGLMVARGDLGAEIPVEGVPIVQKKLIKLCDEQGSLVITATQMLDSMQNNPRLTTTLMKAHS